jgi:hypothetical protein
MAQKKIKHTGTINLADDKKKERLQDDPAQLIVSIIRQQRSLYSKDMNDWIAARAQAEQPIYPMRTLLYNIYLDVILDGFIHGQIYNHRITPVKNKPFRIFNVDKKANDVKTALFEKGWVTDMIEYALESKFFGYSLIYLKELLFDGKTTWIKKVDLIDRKHVRPEAHVVTKYESDFNGIDYTAEPAANYVIPVGKECDLGLLNKAVPLWILKRHSWQNWDNFEEIFGIPIRIAKTASQDPRVQAEMEGWLSDMGSAAYGIFPQNTEIEIKESKHTDAFKVFFEKMQAANEELAILFSGQTMTSMDGSSRSQGEVHERVLGEIRTDDEKFIKTLFNEVLIPLLRDKHGWPLQDGDYMDFDQPEDKVARLAIFQGVYNMGFELDAQQVSEEFSVNILGKRTTPAPVAPGDPAKPADEENEDPNAPDDDNEDEPDDAKALLTMHKKLQALMGGGTHVH